MKNKARERGRGKIAQTTRNQCKYLNSIKSNDPVLLVKTFFFVIFFLTPLFVKKELSGLLQFLIKLLITRGVVRHLVFLLA